MALRVDRTRRRFGRTPEPPGKPRPRRRRGALAYVVQKHDATRLHYDFRLEIDGVMKSWAIPKGPSLDPKVRRLAVQVEDHPLEYNRFEGVIPEGEYGGGPVILWDRGTWTPEGDARESYRKGTLKFRLEGEKLHGSWVLVRTRQARGSKEQWLLIKHQDEAARPGARLDVVKALPKSVASGRVIEDVGPTFRGRRASVRRPRGSSSSSASLRLTNPDKVLYPEDGVTKRRLVEYYLEVQERLVPSIKDRPLSVFRCPDGLGRFCFWVKHLEAPLPRGLRSISLDDAKTEKTRGPYFYAASIEGVLALVQLGALELHVWGSRAAKVEYPDLMIFDVDPDVGLPWARVVEGCRTLRARLEEMGLRSWLKTTGGKGLHVCVPLGRRQAWDEVKEFSRALSEDLARREPSKYTANPLKAQRRGRIFIDYLRNGRGATAVAAWSTRARPGAPVSMPLAWDELDLSLRPDAFTVANAAERLQRADPWTGFFACRQTITAAMKSAVEPGAVPPRERQVQFFKRRG